MKRGTGSEGTSGKRNLDEVRQIWKGKTLNGLKIEKDYLEYYSWHYGKPVQLVKNWGNMVRMASFCNCAGGRDVSQLEFVKEFLEKTKEKRTAVIRMKRTSLWTNIALEWRVREGRRPWILWMRLAVFGILFQVILWPPGWVFESWSSCWQLLGKLIIVTYFPHIYMVLTGVLWSSNNTEITFLTTPVWLQCLERFEFPLNSLDQGLICSFLRYLRVLQVVSQVL